MLAALIHAVGCSSAPPSGIPKPSSPRAVGNQAVLEDVVIDRFEQDRLRFRAHLDRANLDRTHGEVFGQGVHVDVLEKDPARSGEVRSRVDAPRGHTVLASRVVTLEGGVRLEDREGRVLRTAVMTYDGPNDALTATHAVTLEGENFRAEGSSLSGHPMEGGLEVGAPVHAHVEPRPHGPSNVPPGSSKPQPK